MHIHYITNTRNGLKIGERNQALGVVDALRDIYPGAILLEYDVSEIARLNLVLQKFPENKHIIIGVSDSGVKVFSGMQKNNNCISVLIGHEVPEYMETIVSNINILAIPEYVKNCPENIPGVDIIRTCGVANTMTPQKAKSAYLDWKDKFPLDANQTVIVAMLGGAVDGHDLFPGEAGRMAEYVVSKAKKTGAYIIATSSPRSKPADTEDFTTTISNSGCGNVFFPFSIKNQNNETPYRAMVGIVARNPDNLMVVSGDSVSMPCEIARVLKPQQIYLYRVSNLNQQNKEFIEWMCKEGMAGIVNDTGINFVEDYLPKQNLFCLDAGRQIAEAVLSSQSNCFMISR